uniref:Uncharacterized protein n=1 Tax=Salix viminalis TaxID=40686 RepID=A0A6N2LU74_SALVM
MERKSSSVPSPKRNLARAFYFVTITPMIARVDVGCVWFHFGTRKRRGMRLGEVPNRESTCRVHPFCSHFWIMTIKHIFQTLCCAGVQPSKVGPKTQVTDAISPAYQWSGRSAHTK